MKTNETQSSSEMSSDALTTYTMLLHTCILSHLAIQTKAVAGRASTELYARTDESTKP